MQALRARGSGLRIVLSDGSVLDAPSDVLSTHSIGLERELSREQLAELERRCLLHKAERQALSLLARAAHTERNLEQKLLKRGHELPVVREALSRLGEMGYLDDRQTAEAWLRQRAARHPEGRAALVAGLQRRGVSREVAEVVVREHVPESREWELARRALEKLYPGGWARSVSGSQEERRRAARRLAARGFSARVIRRVLAAGEGLEEDLGGEGDVDLNGA